MQRDVQEKKETSNGWRRIKTSAGRVIKQLFYYGINWKKKTQKEYKYEQKDAK